MLSFFMITSLVFSWQMMFLSMTMPMMMCLLLLSISLSFTAGVMFSIWYGIMLFMVYVGGLLVLFMYSAMISSNMKSLWESGLVFGGVIFSIFLMGVALVKNILYYMDTSLPLSGNMMTQSLVSSGITFDGFLIPVIGVFLFVVMISVTSILLKLGKINSN